MQLQGLPGIRMAVNLSAMQFRQPGLPEKVAGILEKTGLDARYLALEITENIAMHNGPEIVTTLNELKALGVIAEGVEKEEQAELLEACGCKEVQGYHFCMPVSEKELR